jgi:pentose-5-phosphate-3-epimerase
LPIAEELVNLGVDRLVIGSAIFSDEDPEEAIEDFLLLNEN